MKNKTKISITLISLVFLLSMIPLAHGKIIDGSKIEITLISQKPDPVEPGQRVDIRFKVENLGSTGTDQIIFEIVPEYPFSIYKGNLTRKIGSMQAYQNGEEGIIVLYELRVDENAIEGDNQLDIRYKFDTMGSQWRYSKDFVVRVRTRDIVLSVDSIQSTPESVAPGKEFELAITLRNNADSLINDVTVKLDFSSDDIPFAPSKSTAEKQIYQINSKTAKILKFDLVALPDAEGGIYKIPINITYTDETGESFEKKDIISLKISSSPDLLVNIDSSEITAKKKSGEVVIKIVNRGLTDIKLMTSKLSESEDISLISESEVYVGNIDSDDYETVKYTLKVKSYDPIVMLPLEITYMDATNKKHRETISLKLKTQSKGLIIAIILTVFRWIIWLVIVTGIGYIGYRIYKRFKKKKRA